MKCGLKLSKEVRNFCSGIVSDHWRLLELVFRSIKNRLRHLFIIYPVINLFNDQFLVTMFIYSILFYSPHRWFVRNGNIQKQPSKGVLRKRCFQKCSKFTGEHPGQSMILIKLQSSFIGVTLRHGCFPVNVQHIFRTPPKNTSGRLLLNIEAFIFCFDKLTKIIWHRQNRFSLD